MKAETKIRPGALSLLAACFILSALARAGDVVAALPQVRDDGFGNRIAPASERAGAPSEIPVSKLAAELRQQAERLRSREEVVARRESELELVEERLRAQLEEIERLRLDLRAEIGRAKTAADDDLRTLTAMYRAMKPKDAARIFNEMEPKFAAGFLGELGADAAGAILANMAPELAYAVSVHLVGRSLTDESGNE